MPLDTPRSAFKVERYDLVPIAIPNPAAGAPVSWAVPDNTVIHVIGVSFMVIASAAVLNRRFYVGVEGPGPLLCPVSPASVDQTANLMWQYHFALGVAPLDATANHYWLGAPLSCQMELKFGDNLIVTSIALDAADQILTTIIRYKEWKED
jgi:hypothetical protein